MSRYFLDTSALVKHYHTEVGTPKVRTILDEPNAEHFIARLTTVEILSGFAIKVRTGVLSSTDFHRLHGLFLADVKRRLLRPVRALNADFNPVRLHHRDEFRSNVHALPHRRCSHWDRPRAGA